MIADQNKLVPVQWPNELGSTIRGEETLTRSDHQEATTGIQRANSFLELGNIWSVKNHRLMAETKADDNALHIADRAVQKIRIRDRQSSGADCPGWHETLGDLSWFQRAKLGLFSIDLSQLSACFEKLRRKGVSDLRAYAKNRPRFADECFDLIRTVHVNDACISLLGAIDKDDLLGPTIFRPSLPDRLDALIDFFDGRGSPEGKAKLQAFDGRELFVMFTAFIDRGEDGRKLDHVVYSLADLTDHETMNERLLNTQQALARSNRVATIGALSASIAHELNQPLSAVLIDAQTARRLFNGVSAPSRMADAVAALDRVIANAWRASDIVRSVWDKITLGRQEPSSVDPVGLVVEAKKLLEKELCRNGVRLQIVSPFEIREVQGDFGEYQQVVLNLLSNGIQAMSAGRASDTAAIDVDVGNTENDMVRIRVRDRGAGISEDHAALLFEPFYTTKSDGMGMGLAICRRIVESYGGNIRAFNHSEGGAVFEIELPACKKFVAPCAGV
jgi:signal transduction histidine kinase